MSKELSRHAERLIDRLYDIQDSTAFLEERDAAEIIAEEAANAVSRINSRLEAAESAKPKNTGININDSGTLEVIKNAIAEALAATGGIEDVDLQEQLHHFLFDTETKLGDIIEAYSKPNPAE